jgi:hypothetical protein
MNEHLNPIFEIVLPTIEQAGISYWGYGGVATAGINGAYLRTNPDVDVSVMNDEYDKTIELVARLEKELGWSHKDAKEQRGRRKRDWFVAGRHRAIFSVVAVYPMDGGRVLFKFGRDFIPNSPLTSEVRRIGNYSFVSPSVDLLKELLIAKSNEPKLLRQRIENLKIDARVFMPEGEYQEFCDWLDALNN